MAISYTMVPYPSSLRNATGSGSTSEKYLKVGYNNTYIKFYTNSAMTNVLEVAINNIPTSNTLMSLSGASVYWRRGTVTDNGVTTLAIIFTNLTDTISNWLYIQLSFDDYPFIPATNSQSYLSTMKTRLNAELSRRGQTQYTAAVPTSGTQITATHYNNIVARYTWAHISWRISNVTAKTTSIAVGSYNQYNRAVICAEALSSAMKQISESGTMHAGCASGCTGLCSTSCSTACYGSCGGNCTGCSSCSGCGGSCDNSCSGDCWDQCTSSSAQWSSFNPGCGDCC